MPLHNSICAEKVKNGRCDKIAAGKCLFVILLEKKGGAGLGRKDAAPVYIHVLWGTKIQNNK
jgi:hypothetical protein